ncbi:MAG TPA: hypothetical protein VKV36_09555 [Acidimicrobiales bacterium]|nr:hypothetical protein [Acidimicrobiales bacterium]
MDEPPEHQLPGKMARPGGRGGSCAGSVAGTAGPIDKEDHL